MTHKRIMVKINGGQSIDTNIKPACFISYCLILAAHNAKHFFLLLIKFNPGKLFFSMLVEIFAFHFFILFHFLIVRMFLFAAGVGFSFTTDFPQVKQISQHLVNDGGNVACDLIYFAPFLDGSCDSESFKASFFSTFYKTRMAWNISLRLNYAISRTAKALKGLLLENNPNFPKLRLVYKVQNAWELRPQ